MKIGTKSVLFGAHCFFIHPFMVAIAWWKLYGFPKDPRIWIAFIVHDWGYFGKPNMDGKEGEKHVELGANIMHWLFDKKANVYQIGRGRVILPANWNYWYEFTLYHSRYYAKTNNQPISKLCVADKYAFCLENKWFYLLRATLSGEVYEYMDLGRKLNRVPYTDKSVWFDHVQDYMYKWTMAHKDNLDDTWTKNE